MTTAIASERTSRWAIHMDDVAAGRAPAAAADLRARLSPSAEVIATAAEREIYARDLAELPPAFAGLFHTRPDIVVQPAAIHDVSEAIRWARARRLPVTPRGLASTAYGGALPTRGGLVLDMVRLNHIGALNSARSTIHVEAGVTWGDLDTHLAGRGLETATYPSSRFSTVGGWVSTGGYGINAIGGGHLSRWVESLEVVLPDGTLAMHSSDDPEFGLFFGAEGQLGVVAAVTLKLRPRAEARPHLCYFDSMADAAAFVARLVARGPRPEHVKLLDSRQMANLNRLHAEEHPGRALVEPRDAVLLTFSGEAASGDFDSFVEQEPAVTPAPRFVASAIWHQRFFPMKVKRFGPSLLAAQVVLPLEEAARFVDDVAQAARSFGLSAETEAYVIEAGGNYECLVMPMFPCDSRRLSYPLYLAFVQMVTRLGILRGGRPYAAGIWNGPFAKDKYGARHGPLLEAKRRLDPDGQFNPGKFPYVRTRFGIAADLIFAPTLFRLTLDVLLALRPIVGLLATLLNRIGPRTSPVPRSDRNRPVALTAEQLEEAIRGCTACGDCLPVCPAYLVTRDETVVGRHKLRTGLRLLRGERVDRLEADKTFLCMYCKACQDVCQSSLPLVSMYEQIEARLADEFGRPDQLIADFIAAAETTAEFYQFSGASLFPPPDAEPQQASEGSPASAPSPAESGGQPKVALSRARPTPPTAARHAARYHIDPLPAPARLAPIGRFTITRADHCINCGQCVRSCIYGVHLRDPLDVRKMAEPVSHLCRNCFRCLQECPRLALSMSFNEEYERQGQGIYTADVVSSLAKQAERGAIPVLGQGYRGMFAGPGFDGIWTDMSEIVRPTRDGIHGREYISTAIDVGRRPERLEFAPDGALLTEMPPALEIPIPLIFGRLPAAERRPRVTEALLRAAHQLGTLAEVEPRDWHPSFEPYLAAAALVIRPDEIASQPGALGRVRMVQLDFGSGPPDLAMLAALRARHAGALIAARLPLAAGIAGRAVDLTRAGVDAIRLAGSDGSRLPPGEAPELVERLPEVHEALVNSAVRDGITLIASGGLAMAEHVAKTILLGADGVAVDWPLAAALECRIRESCVVSSCECGLEAIDPAWGAQRIVNLMASWRNQLLEVLGAMGLREVRRLRGERGRAMFAAELERQYLEPLTPKLAVARDGFVPISDL